MKRVIKFWNQFNNDDGKFSDCGTHYEVLPILVEDSAGPKELREIAKSLGILLNGRKVITHKEDNKFRRGATRMTHAVMTGEKTEPQFFEKKEFNWFLGFVTLNEQGNLPAKIKPKQKMTKVQAMNIVDNRYYGVDNIGEFDQGLKKKNKTEIIMGGWHYYHEMEMLGYDLEVFQKRMGATDRSFYDSVQECDECGIWDSTDDGYTYNHRQVGYKTLGVNCGCFLEHCKANIGEFEDESDKAMDREAADDLESDGKLERLETFIGGMTDGRGGWFKGEATREGTPDEVLKEYKTKMPKDSFVFVHEESGQFQTYFSIFKVVKTKRKAA